MTGNVDSMEGAALAAPDIRLSIVGRGAHADGGASGASR